MKPLLRAVLTAIGCLPLPLLHLVGGAVGWLTWQLPTKHRRITLQHLALAFPDISESGRRRIARTSLIESGKTLTEAPAIWFGRQARLHGWLHDEHAGRALREFAARGGGIVLCPHIGSWELAGMFCALHAGITSLYKPQKGAIDALILEGRKRLGAKLVPTDGSGVRALLRTLKDGRLIGVLPDHDPPQGSGEFAPLFGVAAHTTSLVTRLAARTGRPMCFCYAQRLPWGRGFRFHVAPAPAEIGDPVHGVAALNLGVETVVRHLPGQYWWSYRRYRRRPAGEAPFYD